MRRYDSLTPKQLEARSKRHTERQGERRDDPDFKAKRNRAARKYRLRPFTRAKQAAQTARQRAREAGLPAGDVHWSVIARLHQLPCAYCGKSPALSTDHKLPYAQGGLNEIDNLDPACEPCNNQKASKSVAEYMEYLALLREERFAA